MIQIFNAFSLAFRNLFNLKILWILVWPLLVASLFWLIVGVFIWTPSIEWITELIPFTFMENWFDESVLLKITDSIGGILNVIILVILVIVTAMIITALFVMSSLIDFVAKRYYPLLERKNGGSLVGSLIHIISAIIVFIVLLGIALPFWFVGVGILVSFLAAAYLNQRLFSYDALSEHASKEELEILLTTNKLSLWGLGLLTGLVQFIPILNLFAPTLTALAFIHFELARLDNYRRKSSFDSSRE
ncbi:EI24 domain-containing protein [Nitrosomonas sp. Nm33]|uniref:EI24 domain-containing protein n=1 Tax=Nitrosomonas sp. Nm33 TaxID=133724 RepID=UPI00089442FD|nr:EI24 domain-containing protein [Nitrosomonas sp. Nm33]SDY61154.1 Etoposide-induced protein 2.4 (EI24) [Nitrosomonas sp. Nm33]